MTNNILPNLQDNFHNGLEKDGFCPTCAGTLELEDIYCRNCGAKTTTSNRVPSSISSSPISITADSVNVSQGQIFQKPATGRAAAASKRTFGTVVMLAAGAASLGFFLPWLSMNNNLSNGIENYLNFDIPFTYGNGLSAGSLFYYLMRGIFYVASNSSSSGGNSANVPGEIVITILIIIGDLISLPLVLIAGVRTAVRGFTMMQENEEMEIDLEYRIGEIKSYAIFGLVPTVAFLLIIQGLLGYLAYETRASLSDSVSTGLGLLGEGYWLSLIGLIVIIFACNRLSTARSHVLS